MYPYGGDVPADPGASAEGKTSLSMGVGVWELNSWEQGPLLPATFTLLFPRSQALVADPGTLGASWSLLEPTSLLSVAAASSSTPYLGEESHLFFVIL